MPFPPLAYTIILNLITRAVNIRFYTRGEEYNYVDNFRSKCDNIFNVQTKRSAHRTIFFRMNANEFNAQIANKPKEIYAEKLHFQFFFRL